MAVGYGTPCSWGNGLSPGGDQAAHEPPPQLMCVAARGHKPQGHTHFHLFLSVRSAQAELLSQRQVLKPDRKRNLGGIRATLSDPRELLMPGEEQKNSCLLSPEHLGLHLLKVAQARLSLSR